jgi:hypothetical protein
MKVDGKRGKKGIFKKKEVKERKFFTILQLIFTITILFDLV